MVTQRRLFLLLGLLAALVIVVLRAQSLAAERQQILQQREAQAATLAQFAATYSARLYDQSGRVAREVAAFLRDSNPSDAELQRYLAMRAADTSANDYIVVLDAAGRVRATSEQALARGTSVSFGAEPGAAWRTGEQEVLPVMRSRLTGAVIYSLSQRLEDSAGRFLGVVGVNVRPDGIRPTAARKPEDPLLTVWSQDGRFVAASFVDFTPAGAAIPPARPKALALSGAAPGAGGGSLGAAAPVQGWPLVAVASYDEAGVLKDWRRSVYEAIAFLVFAVAGIGVLTVLGVRAADREALARKELVDANAVAADALKHRDLLIREVDHRVKNSLMMTASLLYLQERRFSDPEVREAFGSTRRRLNSIGLVHEALYRGSSLEEIDLAHYLERLLDELGKALGAEARGVAISLDVEPLLLAPHQTTPVGLIVAEVVTNAFKHAFGANGSGTIEVKARLANLDDIQIEIRDDGVGFAGLTDRRAAEGLGTRLIDALAQQLGGAISVGNEGGAAFRLTFPRLVRGEAPGAAISPVASPAADPSN